MNLTTSNLMATALHVQCSMADTKYIYVHINSPFYVWILKGMVKAEGMGGYKLTQ